MLKKKRTANSKDFYLLLLIFTVSDLNLLSSVS